MRVWSWVGTCALVGGLLLVQSGCAKPTSSPPAAKPGVPGAASTSKPADEGTKPPPDAGSTTGGGVTPPTVPGDGE
jgi:hypothetical protein